MSILAILEEGQVLNIAWRNKPIAIMRRSKQVLENILKENPELVDPTSNEPQQPEFAKNVYRFDVPEIFVIENMCTHLGCAVAYSPIQEEHDYFPEGGFFCLCHGATYDHAGRVYKNMPAPSNLVVPNYEVVNDSIIRFREKERS